MAQQRRANNAGLHRRLAAWTPALATAALLATVGSRAAAYEAVPERPVPEHGSPWTRTDKPDLATVWFWHFQTAADRDEAATVFLEEDGVDALLETDDAGPQAAVAARGEKPPQLKGGCRTEDGAGLFGGGLALDGKGFAEGRADLPDLVANHRGFTLDGWFRFADEEAGVPDSTLVTIGDTADRPLIAVTASRRESQPARVSVSVEGTQRLDAAVPATANGWHHLTLFVDSATLSLAVDGTAVEAVRDHPSRPAAWIGGLQGRLGTRLTVGGADGSDGLRGAIDEVRLSKGRRLLYPWRLGGQELDRNPGSLDLKTPYFSGGGDPQTRFPFDGTLEPRPFAGRSWAGRADAVEFQPGVQGRALDLSRIDRTGFRIAGFDALPDGDGTIEFWFRPLDWNNFYIGDFQGGGVKSLPLLSLRSGNEPDHAASKLLSVSLGRAGKDAAIRWHPIHPGTWSHVLVSVKGGVPTVYLNGVRQKIGQVGLAVRSTEPLARWRTRASGTAAAREAGDDGTWSFMPSRTLVDELCIFSWPMTEEEAWNAYARWLPDAAARMRPLPEFKTTFDYFAHSSDLQPKLVASLTCLPIGDARPTTADMEIRTASGEVLLAAERQPLDEAGHAGFTVAAALPFGRYPVVVRSRDAAGAVLREQSLEYVRERPDWFENTLGEERTVPKPWTPIAVDGDRLEVIGRRITLGDDGLPATIEALGRPLLAAPVAIRAAGPGGAGPLAGAGTTFGETAADRVAWKASLAGAGLSGSVDALLEFDGLLVCTVTLAPAAGDEVVIEELDVDVPLVPDSATQLLANGGGKDFRASWIAKMLPDGTGSVWNSLEQPYPGFGRAVGVTNFMPHVWLGADDVGLYFGAENDRGWTVDGPRPAQEILRQDGAVIFRMNVIRETTRIPAAGRRFHFILLPTPAKPEPPDWRKQMAVGGVNFGACDSFGGFDMKTDPSDPVPGDDFRLEPRSWEHAAAMAPQCRAKWGRCILYADASFPGRGPSFRDWDHELFNTGRFAWTPECEDYAVWAVNEFLRRGLIDGVYWDDVSVGNTLSLASTAYEHEGSPGGRRVGFTTLAQRRVNMRLWRLFESAGREPCIWAHMTVCYEVPLFSFCRYLSNGEFTTGVDVFGKRDAMDYWSPETLRVLGDSAKWGAGVSFLTTLPRFIPASPAAEQWAYPQRRTEDAVYAACNIFTLSESLVRRLAAERVFDGPIRAFPWWKAGPFVKLTAPPQARVLPAVYALDGRAIVFLANFDRDAEHEVAVELDLDALFPGGTGKPGTGVVWRDLDPGLEPPAAAAATAAEIAKTKEALDRAGLDAKEESLDEEAIGDFLEGTSPEGRARARLELRVEGTAARVLVRPRDYRVLEARPR